MSGLPKHGLDYYSLDVDFFNSIKVRKLLKTHGSTGVSIYIFILCELYSKGHYLEYNKEDILFILHERLFVDSLKAEEVIVYLVEDGLFDKKMFELGYLTSKKIQEIYYLATKRRIVRITDTALLLSDENKQYLDSVLKGKKVSKDYNDSIVVNIDEQSKSNSKSKSESNRDKIMINDSFDVSTLPFNPHFNLTKFIESNVLEYSDDNIEKLNDYFYQVERVDYKVMLKAVKYTINRIQNNKWKDDSNHSIVNKCDYIIGSLERNVNIIKSNKSRTLSSKDLEELVDLNY